VKRWKILIHVRGSLWFVPVLCVLAGAAISFSTITLDRLFDYQAIPASIVGHPEAAISILSTVAASMVSLTALVLTITMVVVQLAMGQFSPRIVQRILRDKPSQLAIGLFVATFVHAILTLREVTSNGDGTGHVPGIAVLAAFLLVIASIAVLVIYVQHLAQALRVSALIELVANDTRGLVDRIYPDKNAPDSRPERMQIVSTPDPGVIAAIGYDELVAEAVRADCMLELIPAVGDFVPAQAPLFRVHGKADHLDEDKVRHALVLKLERTLDEDVAYGIRMLVDIAERSLAESQLQDPTPAVQAIDRLHDILRQLAGRTFPDGRHLDETGQIRLLVRVRSWDDYLQLATEEIILVGAGSPPVVRHLQAALTDLRGIAPPERRAAIDQQLERLAEVVETVGAPQAAIGNTA
jgi:uncharacterized membrane protein